LLDVGCGVGSFLEFAKRRTRLNLYGSEFSEVAFEKLSEFLGGNLFHKMCLSEIGQSINNKFDLIFFWGVLEHVTNPLENLISASKLLKPQGRILAVVPNFHSRAMKLLGINTPTLNPREHIQFFTMSSMSKCAEQASLKIEMRNQELPMIDLMYPYLKVSEGLIADIMERQEAYYDVYIFQHT
jgi:SAM-dependent methyltransferase